MYLTKSALLAHSFAGVSSPHHCLPAACSRPCCIQVISVQHTIDRREVEAKKALPKEESPVSKDQQVRALLGFPLE